MACDALFCAYDIGILDYDTVVTKGSIFCVQEFNNLTITKATLADLTWIQLTATS